MSLAKDSLIGTDWQFGSQLTTEHVWDAFIIMSLLEDKLRAHQQLQVPHTGLQKDRFKEAMAERNKDFVLNGQPDAVCHACDKCFRRYETEDGEIRKFDEIKIYTFIVLNRLLGQCHPIVGDGLSIGRPCCATFACREPLQNNRHRYCKTPFSNTRFAQLFNAINQSPAQIRRRVLAQSIRNLSERTKRRALQILFSKSASEILRLLTPLTRLQLRR